MIFLILPNQLFDIKHFDKSFKHKNYTVFSIGAQYIVTREYLQRISKSVYKDFLQVVSHGSKSNGYVAECFIVKRALDGLWLNQSPMFNPHSNGLDQLPISSGTHYKKTVRMKVMFTLIRTIAEIINRPKRVYVLIRSSLYNRARYMLNSYFT